jgi:predicted nucleotidyltransferase
VFGSVASESDRDGSDLDLLVEVDETVTLFSLADLERRLTDLLGVRVDVRTEKEISPYIRDRVIAQARPL